MADFYPPTYIYHNRLTVGDANGTGFAPLSFGMKDKPAAPHRPEPISFVLMGAEEPLE
ncbi:MAG: hypothetical protein GY841_12020 [FCB group bacterium]|nr:hypothetical protein [FCB group bacterium]